MIRIKGVVFSGVLRGASLVDLYYYRVVSLLGFEPYKGTMDVKLERPINIRLFETKSIEHLLLDGSRMVNAYLTPVNIVIRKGSQSKRYECWAMQEAQGIYSDDVVEIISKDRIKDKFEIEDGNIVEIEFSEKPKKKGRTLDIIKKFRPKKTSQLMKR